MKKCLVCQKEFKYYKHNRKIYCSNDCYWKSMKGKRSSNLDQTGRPCWKKGIIEWKNCKSCEIKIRKWRKYCSPECYMKNKSVSNNLKNYAQKGSVPWNKDTGKTDLHIRIRKTEFYRNWRRKVHKICEFKCVRCGSNQNLIADHIKSFYQIIEENNISSLKDAENTDSLWDVSNGRSLCNKCHRETDNYGYKAVILYKNQIQQQGGGKWQ